MFDHPYGYCRLFCEPACLRHSGDGGRDCRSLSCATFPGFGDTRLSNVVEKIFDWIAIQASSSVKKLYVSFSVGQGKSSQS
jgi:hypothetical protein